MTLGADRVQGVSPMSTVSVALVLLTDTVVRVMPETGSVKLLPTPREVLFTLLAERYERRSAPISS